MLEIKKDPKQDTLQKKYSSDNTDVSNKYKYYVKHQNKTIKKQKKEKLSFWQKLKNMFE